MSKSSFYLYLILGLLWKSNDVSGDIYKETVKLGLHDFA